MDFYNPKIRYGFHIPKDGTITKSLLNFVKLGTMRSFQIYISNARSWKLPLLDVVDLLEAKDIIRLNGLSLVIHGSLLYNLCGSVKLKKDEKYSQKLSNMLKGLISELDIASVMGIGVIVHMGTCYDRDLGLKHMIKNIQKVLSQEGAYTKKIADALGINVQTVINRRKLVLENSSDSKNGQKLCYTLEDIAYVLNNIPKYNIRVCIDTCHIFAAKQYHFGERRSLHRFFKDFDGLIGIHKLHCFHLNDSLQPYGSKMDRHWNLTEGYIFSGEEGKESLKELFKYIALHEIPTIGEPPAKSAGGLFDFGVVMDYLIL